MSQFDADPFLQQIAAGVGNLDVARRNFETKANVALQGQALRQQAASEANRAQMQQTELAAQAQMQQQAQAAQSADYAQLNASRERMAQQEMAQQQSQFEQSQAQNKELMMLQNRTAIRLQQIEAEKRKVDAEILAAAKNDPRLVELRKRRRDLNTRAINVEAAMNSTTVAHTQALGVRGQRGEEIKARLASFQEANKMQRQGAEDATTRGIDDAILAITRGNGFWGQAVRAAPGIPGTGIDAVMPGATLAAGGLEVLLENLGESILGISNPQDYRERLSDTTTSPLAMAGFIADRTLDNHSDGLGLKSGQKDVVKTAMMKVLAGGARLGRSEDWTGDLNAQQQEAIKGEIAAGLQQLRASGMSDAQIMGMLESMEGLAENQSQMIGRLGGTGADASLSTVLEGTLTGVGRIIDAVQAVGDDGQLMGGQKIVDHSKMDLTGMYVNGMAAYATAEGSPQMLQFRQQMSGMGMSREEMEKVIEPLLRADPDLKDLDPRVVLRMLEAQRTQAADISQQLFATTEEERLLQEEMLGRAGMRSSDIESQLLDELASQYEG